MSSAGFTLGDRLGIKVAACQVRGCTRTWTDLSSNRALADATTITDENRGMCEPCRRRWASLSDKDMPCARAGCDGTWPWSAQAQLENHAAGKPAPKRFCTACDDKLKNLQPVEITCVVPGCGRSSTLTAKQQLLGESGPVVEVHEGGITLTGPLCGRCSERAPHILDVPVACGIQKCKRTWTWKADEQIVAFAAGKPKEPPRRMCEVCRDAYGAVVDREIRCRASGCKRNWVWTREQQLDACTADKPVPKPPAHLCEECFKTWSGLQDAERPCRRSGCKNTWTEKRGAQLARILRGKTGEPFPQFCESCAQQVEHLKDREVRCKTEGCKHTWTWSAQQQFMAGARPTLRPDASGPVATADAEPNPSQAEATPPLEATTTDASPEPVGVEPEESSASPEGQEPEAGQAPEANEAASPEGAPAAKSGRSRRRRRRRSHIHPPSRHCQFCSDFLGKHKTIELPCASCGTPIFWPPESQLQTALGNWEIPKLCGACKRDLTEADRQKAKSEILHHAQNPGGTTADAPAEPADATERPTEVSQLTPDETAAEPPGVEPNA